MGEHLGAHVLGRGRELRVLHNFLRTADELPGTILFTGDPGMGKTTLWEAGVDDARHNGFRVLAARPSETEMQLSYAALTDIMSDVDTENLAGVPAPQLRALEIAILRTAPTGTAIEPHAVAMGFLNTLRSLAEEGSVLVAIDDLQWLDAASAETLSFAARRLEGVGIRFLFTRRSQGDATVEQALRPHSLQRIEVGPLSLGAIRRMLFDRLGLSLPRRALLRIFEASLGNPLFALEIGRSFSGREGLEIGDDVPVPDALEDVFRARIRQLPSPARKLLLAVALSADPRVPELEAIAEPNAIDDAVAAGLIVVEGDRVRASHPLFASAAKSHSRESERRDIHTELAAEVAGMQERARHLMLAAQEPNPELAAKVFEAAQEASARGLGEEAAELAGHAFRLTPPEANEHDERLLVYAEYLLVAGEQRRTVELLKPEVEALSGAMRGRAHLVLADALVAGFDDVQHQLELASAFSDGDPTLKATVAARKTENVALVAVQRILEAEHWSREALPAARDAGPDAERMVLYGLAWARILLGYSIDEIVERYLRASDAAFCIGDSVERIAGVRLLWRGNVADAQRRLTRLLTLADQQGEAWSYYIFRLHLCELALRSGDWHAATHVLDEWDQSSEESLTVVPNLERCRALLAAGRGLPAEAAQWADKALARAESGGIRWDWLEAMRARGIAALLDNKPKRAVESLEPVWDHTQREGVADPGAFPVAPDIVEALVEVGNREQASAVTRALLGLAEQQQHPWGLATAKRCSALVQLSSGTYKEEAAAELTQAVTAYAGLGLRFDAARSLLILGRAARRSKKWAAARGALQQAATSFDEIDSPGWAEQARSELARVGARRPRPTGELTPAEQRTAELAAQGLSNKEIAHSLFVGIHTVEGHLSHAYAKLGIRSRTQLARRLSPPEEAKD